MLYAGAADTGPCEGRQASPSNPTGAGRVRTKEPLTETFVFRCSAAEKAQLRPIARWLNRVMLAGRIDLDALTVADQFLSQRQRRGRGSGRLRRRGQGAGLRGAGPDAI